MLGIPAARQTDVFAEGKVQIVEFDVPRRRRGEHAGRPRAAPRGDPRRLASVAGLIRGDRMIVPRGDERILPGDRVVVIGSPDGRARVEPASARATTSASTTS